MKKLVLLAAVAAATAAPFAGPASATVCKSWSVKDVASAGVCDENDYWLWCAGVSAPAAAGVGACQWRDRPGIFVGCWTSGGLRCN